MSGLGPKFMRIWICGNSPRSGSRNTWTHITNVNGACRLNKFGIFSARSIWFPVAIGNHERNLVVSLWPGDKATINGVVENRLTPPQNFQVQNSAGKVLACLDFLVSRQHPPHWLSSKGPNYQRGVLLISAGATEGHFEGKTSRGGKLTEGILFLHRVLAAQKKLAYLGFQCLNHPPYSPDLAPSDYHLFPWLKKQLKFRHFLSDTEVIAAVETWLYRQTNLWLFFGLQMLEQGAKKCIELRGEYV